LALLSGCGARSSTLDPEAYTVEPNLPASGSTGSPASGAGGAGSKGSGAAPSGTGTGGKAGGPATGTGAAGGSPAGGTPAGGASMGGTGGSSTGGAAGAGGATQAGAAGVDPYVYSRCTNYCSATTQGRCPTSVSLGECLGSCVTEVSSRSPECQKNAASLLDCLTAAYQNSNSCSQFDELAYAKCSGWAASYQGCADYPAPTPVPDPSPAPTCSSSGNSSNGSCSLDVKCDNGAYYSVRCYEGSPAQSNCSCKASLPGGPGVGVVGFNLNESVTFACYDSLATCGFPQIGPQ